MTFDVNTITGFRIAPMSEYQKGQYHRKSDVHRLLTRYELANLDGGKHQNKF